MKRPIDTVVALIFASFFGVGCDRPDSTNRKSPHVKTIESPEAAAAVGDESPYNQDAPTTLDEALDLMMGELTDEDRKFIEAAGDEYATTVHFGGGMGMRNSRGLWGDSPLSRYFARLGIYHADDKSAIISEALSRRVRGKDIELEKLVQYYRDYWEKEDTVAPLDLACPHCTKEMVTGFLGEGVSDAHPERPYFYGTCPDGEVYRFYHKDGWMRDEEINGEQQGTRPPATRPASDSEGGEKPEAVSEERSR